MKKILTRPRIFWLLITSFFIINSSKASSKGDVTNRVNKIRTKLQEKVNKGDVTELTNKDFYHSGKVNEWINWGNWGNWNNWNNWQKWNDWGNWGNWGNWRNY